MAVEPVLVALLEAAQALVALEDVLERAAPRGVDSEGEPVGGHRPVDERPPLATLVPGPELLEGTLALPEVQDLQLQSGVIGLVRKRREHGLLRVPTGKKGPTPGV